MANIDFGTLVTAVVNELNCTTSELSGDETTNPDLAVKRYARNVIGVIREVFEEAETRADDPSPATCSYCGTVLEEEARFCAACGMPQKKEAPGDSLERMLAKDAGTTPDDPRFKAVVARIREEQPEAWDALVQLIAAPVKA